METGRLHQRPATIRNAPTPDRPGGHPGKLPAQAGVGRRAAALTDEVLTETGASSKKDMNRVMAPSSQKTGGNFDKVKPPPGSWARSWPEPLSRQQLGA